MWKHGKLIFRKRKAQHDSQSYVPKQRLGSDAGSSQSSLGSQVSNGSVDGTFTALEELITANIETFPKKRARSPEWREYLQHLHALRDTVAKHKLTVNQPNRKSRMGNYTHLLSHTYLTSIPRHARCRVGCLVPRHQT